MIRNEARAGRSLGAAWRWLAPLLVTWMLLAVAISAGGCEPQGDREAVVDPALIAFLSKARAAHHRADLAERDGSRKDAIAAVSTILDGPQPPTSPELVEVVADARARRADLRSQDGDFEGAARDIEEGLQAAVAITHFRGHLYEVGGLVAERQATTLGQAGNGAAAAAANERAIVLYEQAIDVQDKVIEAALVDQ